MINHRYDILKKLGEGGTGEVFLVEDTIKHRQRCAMKVLHPQDRSDPGADEQFRNEVAILATLRHPNLVRIFDFGLVRSTEQPALEGRRFFTMESIEGLDALRWCEAIADDQIRAQHLHSLVIQSLAVLSYIHRQGVIHFDVKPENFVILGEAGEDGLPLLKLTDFGFSIRQDSGLEFSLRGTLHYTAPELLRNEPFDHRIDLYSLGATFYHLVEGHCPFEAADPVDLIKVVLTEDVTFSRCILPEYSRFAPLLRGLLQKDPTQRFESAEAAARSLMAEEADASRALMQLSSKPRFVGRTSEKGTIQTEIELLGKTPTGSGGVVLMISGPEGIGKTALLGEVARHARSHDIPVFEVGGGQSDMPFNAIRPLLLSLRAEMLSRSGNGTRLVEKHAELFASIDQGKAEGQLAEWTKEKEKLTEVLARFVNLSSSLAPFVVVADDVDQIDSESLEVLRVVARDAQVGKILLLLSGREEGSVQVSARQVPLRELEMEEVGEMSKSVFSPQTLGQAIGNALYDLYGGTPLLIVEALHSVSMLLPMKVPT
ncbi:MAG: serine/threonine-protein kinase, partial [Bacteroidota bacterium]